MKKLYILVIAFIFLTKLNAQFRLHPSNPHYFEYKGHPIILVASSEHYGAVINMDFDFVKYLTVLKKIGLNHTRIFLGDYIESSGAFCIANNTLNPDSTKYLAPWQRSNEPGYSLGGNKFNLDEWNRSYFKRLHKFMKLAEKNGVIVEAVLFFASWTIEYSPLFYKNNINNTDKIKANEYMTLTNGNILQRQKEYCKKIVNELNGYDNLIINIANEPWFDNQEHPSFASTPPEATKKWIKKVSEWIISEESSLPKKHIVSVDFTNEGQIISKEDANNYYKNISIFNHHYDRNAKSVELNYNRINRAFAFNETGLMPPKTSQYRIQGWKYIFSGGAIYNNLDFTFQVGAEDGSGTTNFICDGYSGCNDPNVKYQLANLLKYVSAMNFIYMKPNYEVVALNYGDENIYPLIWEGHEYAIYFEGGTKAKIKLNIPSGEWNITWSNPADIKIVLQEKVIVENNFLVLQGPNYKEDVVLYISKY